MVKYQLIGETCLRPVPNSPPLVSEKAVQIYLQNSARQECHKIVIFSASASCWHVSDIITQARSGNKARLGMFMFVSMSHSTVVSYTAQWCHILQQLVLQPTFFVSCPASTHKYFWSGNETMCGSSHMTYVPSSSGWS